MHLLMGPRGPDSSIAASPKNSLLIIIPLLDYMFDLSVVGHCFCSFLLDRSQRLVLEFYSLSPWPLAYGLPQGSVCCTILFNMYIKLLGLGCDVISMLKVFSSISYHHWIPRWQQKP